MKTFKADEYTTGGWTQNLGAFPKRGMTTVMYGMIEDLEGLTTARGCDSWSPVETHAPLISASSLWSYGGDGCFPRGMPDSDPLIDKMISATTCKCWSGIDVVNGCGMDSDKIITLFNKMHWKQKSYTFYAGSKFNNPEQHPEGEFANNEVLKIYMYTDVDRFILKMYDGVMWSLESLHSYVGPGMKRLLNMGVPAKKIFATATTKGLTIDALNHIIDEIKRLKVGGLFIWDYENLLPPHLDLINTRLSINNGAK
ncbi:MAG TPA: hypothetical protein EYO59_12400 [Chromatiaceae bacterium]|nr:hypothetical protein [Chromatiaceae bacterium]